jgi:hypothetical protein
MKRIVFFYLQKKLCLNFKLNKIYKKLVYMKWIYIIIRHCQKYFFKKEDSNKINFRRVDI